MSDMDDLYSSDDDKPYEESNPDVEAGIKKHIIGQLENHPDELPGTFVPAFEWIDYQPGNGTRYECIFTFVPGRPDFAAVLAIPNMGKSMFVPNGGPVDWGYVGEKLKMNRADAEPMARLINWVTDFS